MADAARVDARPAVTTTVTCQPLTRTTTHADGRREVWTYYQATIATVGPDTDFTLEQCGTLTPPSCPANATCTGSMEPPGEACWRSRRSGRFIDGKLHVQCSFLVEFYSAAGALTSSGRSGYEVTRLTVH